MRDGPSESTIMARDLTKIRNIGIAAHIDAGKTTTSERILYYTGRIHKVGEVHDGTAVMDFDPEEQKRGITINSAATYCKWGEPGEWLKKKEDQAPPTYDINLIDTPGHVDFTVEVERSLRVLDGAVAVFDGKEGVEAQSETVWRQATKYNVPRICFINKMDKVGADYEFCYRTILDRLGAPAIPVVIPDGQADSFKGVIDLIKGVAYYSDPSDPKGNLVVEKPVPEHMKEKYDHYRAIMLEKVAELDDALMDKYLTDPESLQPDELRAALRKGTIAFKAHPLFCGSRRTSTSACRSCSTGSSTTCPTRWTCPRPRGPTPRTRTRSRSARGSRTPRSAGWRSRSWTTSSAR